MEKTTLLVTGATGFIGSYLVRLLLETVSDKVVASNLPGVRKMLKCPLNPREESRLWKR